MSRCTALAALFKLAEQLQIGANTMDNPNDPFSVHLGRYSQHRKVFVEPIPVLFQKLTKNLAHMPNATFVNAAISNKTEGGHQRDPTLRQCQECNCTIQNPCISCQELHRPAI